MDFRGLELCSTEMQCILYCYCQAGMASDQLWSLEVTAFMISDELTDSGYH